MKPSELKSILSHWPKPFPSANLVDRHRGFSGAIVYRLDVQGEHFALREWRKDQIPVERLQGLHGLLRFVFDRGITQVSVPVPTTKHQTFHQRYGVFRQIEPWMPGRADFREDPSDEKLRSAMRTLARFHLAANEFAADSECSEWFSVQREARSPTIGERLERLEYSLSYSGDPFLLRQIDQIPVSVGIKSALHAVLSALETHGPSVREELQSLHSSKFRLQPSLRDVWHDHILFEGDEVTGLIDPSACRSENPVIDLSRLLVSFDVSDRTGFALDVYEQLRPLTPDEHRLRRVFDRSQFVLGGVTWIERLVTGLIDPDSLERIETRLNEIIGRLPLLES
ncbi:MAG TPA: phosphotransferase [Planctomycetaceae bacterium]|nr:phosphotransferase [Planctomycetaceae bacterium]